MTEAEALTVFASLSSETRLRILKALVVAGPEGLTAGAIAERAEASPSRASFHLSHMADAGLVTSTRQARQITYRVAFETIGGLITYLMQDCCNNSPEVQACCGWNAHC